MTSAMVAAMLLRDLICGVKNPYADVFDPARFDAAALAGIVYLIILWSKGMLSRTAIIVIASVAVVAVALALFGRLRGGN